MGIDSFFHYFSDYVFITFFVLRSILIVFFVDIFMHFFMCILIGVFMFFLVDAFMHFLLIRFLIHLVLRLFLLMHRLNRLKRVLSHGFFLKFVLLQVIAYHCLLLHALLRFQQQPLLLLLGLHLVPKLGGHDRLLRGGVAGCRRLLRLIAGLGNEPHLLSLFGLVDDDGLAGGGLQVDFDVDGLRRGRVRVERLLASKL